jgi:hypothetical protein
MNEIDKDDIAEARGQVRAAYTQLERKPSLGHYDMLAKTRVARAYMQLGGDKQDLEGWMDD